MFFPSSYWLLLLAGDIETNPGLIKFPCTMCSKPVKRNQHGIQCDSCDLWTHAYCCNMGTDEYWCLSVSETEWLCPTCLISELPYANSSLVSDASLSLLNLTNTSDSSLEPNLSPLTECKTTPIFCHLNVQSLLPKMDKFRLLLSEATRPAIVGVSETWLNSSVQDSEVSISSFELYRRDRRKHGGGVLVYVPGSYCSRRRTDLD